MSYLDRGGRLFLTSQDAVEVLSASSDPWDTLFLRQYLHVGYAGNNTTQHLVAGQPGDEVGDTLWIYPEGVPGANNQTSKDMLVPDAESDTVMVYANSQFTPTQFVAATKYPGDFFKVVVFGFGFEGINSGGGYFHTKWLSKPQFVMQRVLDWLKAPLPTLYLDSPNGGDVWFIGDSTDILWQSVSFNNKVRIELSIDAGSSWSVLADSAANTGTYSLEIPNTPSDSCLVRISDATDGVPSAVSDGYFSITNYVPGDPNGDKVVDVGDVVYLINFLFRLGSAPNPMAAGDANGDCVVDVGDVVYLINYLFRSGPSPVPGCA
jgi:hypothetical protein